MGNITGIGLSQQPLQNIQGAASAQEGAPAGGSSSISALSRIMQHADPAAGESPEISAGTGSGGPLPLSGHSAEVAETANVILGGKAPLHHKLEELSKLRSEQPVYGGDRQYLDNQVQAKMLIPLSLAVGRLPAGRMINQAQAVEKMHRCMNFGTSVVEISEAIDAMAELENVLKSEGKLTVEAEQSLAAIDGILLGKCTMALKIEEIQGRISGGDDNLRGMQSELNNLAGEILFEQPGQPSYVQPFLQCFEKDIAGMMKTLVTRSDEKAVPLEQSLQELSARYQAEMLSDTVSDISIQVKGFFTQLSDSRNLGRIGSFFKSEEESGDNGGGIDFKAMKEQVSGLGSMIGRITEMVTGESPEEIFSGLAEHFSGLGKLKDSISNVGSSIRDTVTQLKELLPEEAAGALSETSDTDAAKTEESPEEEEDSGFDFEALKNTVSDAEEKLAGLKEHLDTMWSKAGITAKESVGSKTLEQLGEKRSELQELAPQILTVTEDRLMADMDKIEADILADRNVSEIDRKIRTCDNMDGLQAFYDEKQALLTGESGSMDRLEEALGRLEHRIRSLNKAAVDREDLFHGNIRERIDNHESYESLHRVITDHIENLESGQTNLMEEQAGKYIDQLAAEDQRCLVQDFMEQIGTAVSTQVEVLSLEEISAQIDGFSDADMTAESRTRLKNELTAASSKILQNSTAALEKMGEGLEQKSLAELRGISLTGFMDVEKKMLAGDLAQFKGLTDAFATRLKDACFKACCRENDFVPTDKQSRQLRLGLEKSGYHPSFIQAVKTRIFSDEIMVKLGTALSRQELSPELAEDLNRLALQYTELEASVLEIKLACVPEDQREAVTREHLSFSLRRQLMVSLKEILPASRQKKMDLSGQVVSVRMLADMVQKLGEKSAGRLNKADLKILQAFWAVRQSEGLSFPDFQKELPEPFRKLTGLESLLNSGLRSMIQVSDTGKVLKRLGASFGTLEEMKAIADRMLDRVDKNAAAEALTMLTQNLLKGGSFTGLQAFAGNASAVTNKIHEELNAAGEEGQKSLAEFMHASPELLVQMHQYGNFMTTYMLAKQTILDNPIRKHLLDVMKEARPGDETVQKLERGVNEKNINGEILSFGILKLNEILNDFLAPDNQAGEFDLEDLKYQLASVDFQAQMDLDRMEGAKIGRKGVTDQDFFLRKNIENILELEYPPDPTPEQCREVRTRAVHLMENIRGILTEHDSVERAKAVAFFKSISEDKASKNFAEKYAAATTNPESLFKSLSGHSIKGSKAALARAADIESRMKDKYMSLLGAGIREAKHIAAAEEEQNMTLEEMKELVIKSEEFLQENQKEILGDSVKMALCLAFAQYPGAQNMEDLLKERDLEGPEVQNWKFFRNVMEIAVGTMNLPRALVEPLVTREIMGMQPDTFTQMVDDLGKNKVQVNLNQMRMKSRMNYPPELEKIIRQDQCDTLAQEYVGMLEDGKGVLTLFAENQGKVTVPVYEDEAVDVSACVSLASRKGMTVWKDKEGYHMTLQKSAAAGASVSASVGTFLGNIKGKVGANIEGADGMDLKFTSAKACSTFLGLMLNGQANSTHLELCSTISPIVKMSIGAEVSVSAETRVNAGAVLLLEDAVAGTANLMKDPDKAAEAFKSEGTLKVSANAAAELGWERKQLPDGFEYTKSRFANVDFHLELSSRAEEETDEAQDAAEGAEGTPETGGAEGAENAEAAQETRKPEEVGENKETDEAEGEEEEDSTAEENAGEDNPLTLSVNLTYEEKNRVTYDNDGKLTRAVSTWIFNSSDMESLQAALDMVQVPRDVRRDVLQQAEALGGVCHLEIDRALPENVVQDVQNNSDMGYAALYKMSEARLTGQVAGASHSIGFANDKFALKHTVGGLRDRTLTFKPQ